MGNQCVDWKQTLVKSSQEQFFPIVLFSGVEFSWKTYLLVTSEILGLIFDILTVDNKYSCYKNEKSQQVIQMQLSKKTKDFLSFFIAFLKSASNFQHFEKEDQIQSSTISDIIDSERSSYLNTLKAMF